MNDISKPPGMSEESKLAYIKSAQKQLIEVVVAGDEQGIDVILGAAMSTLGHPLPPLDKTVHGNARPRGRPKKVNDEPVDVSTFQLQPTKHEPASENNPVQKSTPINEIKSGKNSFVMYTRYSEPFNILSGDNVKRLMAAIFTYVEHGKLPDFKDDAALNMAFAVVRGDLDRDAVKWEEAKAKMSEAGKLGAEKRWGQRTP